MRYLMSAFFFLLFISVWKYIYHDISFLEQHKLGGDRIESFQAVPVDENNRLKDIGPAREIQVCTGSN
jgi:hypothetical protein